MVAVAVMMARVAEARGHAAHRLSQLRKKEKGKRKREKGKKGKGKTNALVHCSRAIITSVDLMMASAVAPRFSFSSSIASRVITAVKR